MIQFGRLEKMLRKKVNKKKRNINEKLCKNVEYMIELE